MEISAVQAVTHRQNLCWIRLVASKTGDFSQMLSFLCSIGEHPFFVQQQQEPLAARVDLVLGIACKDKFLSFVAEAMSAVQCSERASELAGISVIGKRNWLEPELLERVLNSLGQEPVLFDCSSAGAKLLIPQKNLHEFMQSLHQELMEVAVK